MTSVKKHLREIREIVEERGWEEAEITSGNHIRLRHSNPDVDLVHLSATPGTPHWRDHAVREMRQAERQAGLLGNGGPEPVEESEPTETDVKDDPLHCSYCGRGPFARSQDRASHERACDDNPDVWENCRWCSRPCKGPVGRAAHERNCPKRPEAKGEAVEEDDEEQPDEETTDPEQAAPSEEGEDALRERLEDLREQETLPSEEAARETVRGILVDLLREYEALDAEAEKDSLLDPALVLHSTLEATTDLILEVAGRRGET